MTDYDTCTLCYLKITEHCGFIGLSLLWCFHDELLTFWDTPRKWFAISLLWIKHGCSDLESIAPPPLLKTHSGAPIFGFYSLSLLYLWNWDSFSLNFYFNWRLITLQYCGGFAIHSHESAMGVHVFPILTLPPTSLSISSLRVIAVKYFHESHLVIWCLKSISKFPDRVILELEWYVCVCVCMLTTDN